MIEIQNSKPGHKVRLRKFGHLNLGFVSDWPETGASPDIWISDLTANPICFRLCWVR